MKHHQEDSKLPMPESKPLIPFSFSNGGPRNQTMYKQCMKNHAAAIGGHAVDGCGEFMPSSAAEPSDPSSLKCAACGCHRNFHRRVLHSDNSYRSSATPPPRQQLITAPPPRKRARTKFSDEQKLKMKELSERLGWRMQKGDGATVESVCREIGVNQGVFKVWMHNNKHIFVGGSSSRRGGGGTAAAGSGGTDDESGGAATGHE